MQLALGMHEQNQVASTLASADGMNWLKDLLAQAGPASRTEMGRPPRAPPLLRG